MSGKHETVARLFKTKEEAYSNARLKVITTPEGEEKIIQKIVADRPIFNNGFVQDRESKKKKIDKQSITRTIEDFKAEFASNADEYKIDHPSPEKEDENKKRAGNRAKTAVRDFIQADNDLVWFCTFTLSGEHFPRDDHKAAIKALTTWLNNRVQRCGLKYIFVPELHKDGKAIHFHGMINDALQLRESGTLITPTGGKPILRSTAKRKGYKIEDCTPVYNIPGWVYGFSTAIPVHGERAAVASYVAKYITKDTGKKIAGRYYWHSSNLRKPTLIAYEDDYETAEGVEYENPGCRMKIWYPDKDTEFCKSTKNGTAEDKSTKNGTKG